MLICLCIFLFIRTFCYSYKGATKRLWSFQYYFLSAFQLLHAPSEFEGSWVGLVIVKNIIERHGGSIWVESELNKDPRFFFTLPAMK